MDEITTIQRMTLDGGDNCLDFINAGYDFEPGIITERLHSYTDLLILAERLRLFDPADLQHLKKMASADPAAADNALATGRETRSLLYKLFAHLAQKSGEELKPEVLKALNELFGRAVVFRSLAFHGRQPAFIFDFAAAGLLAPVWKIVLSAYDLLNAGQAPYIRQCGRCAWLFLDKTKNHRKRWCSMASCGNSLKTQRYYARKKQHA